MLDSSSMRGGKKAFSAYGNYISYALLILLFVAAVVILTFTRPFEYFTNGETVPTLEYYYMETCPHCKDFMPIWEETVTGLKGLNVKPIKYDLNNDGKERGNEFGITGAPTIYYVKGVTKVEYKGPRTVEGLVAFVKAQA